MPRYQLVYTLPSGQPCGPPLSQQWSHRPPQEVAPRSPDYPRLAAPPQAPQLAEVGFLCFHCGQIGQFSHECPQPRQGFTPRAPPALVGQPRAVVHPLSLRVGRSNFTTLEEIPLGEDVLDDTFFLYEHRIILLLDSVASHDLLRAYA
jgi:hypothetical protein